MPKPDARATDAGPWSPIARCICRCETNGLHDAREREAEDQRPERRPEHEEGFPQAVADVGERDEPDRRLTT